jgi:hypothetical protein
LENGSWKSDAHGLIISNNENSVYEKFQWHLSFLNQVRTNCFARREDCLKIADRFVRSSSELWCAVCIWRRLPHWRTL